MENKIELQVGVKALLRNKAGKFLLLRRSSEKYPEAEGRWDIVGGRINPGKTLMENLRREVSEETGLVLAGEPVLAAAQDILRNGRHVVRLTYVGNADGEVKLDTGENDAYKWCAKEDLFKMEDLDVYFRQLLDRGVIPFR